MIDETQKLDSQNTQAVINESQIIINENENKIVKTDENNKSQNGHHNISHYCLKLINLQNENFSLSNGHDDVSNSNSKLLFPLNIGLTKIGRSDSNDICFIHKSVSKQHGCIELTLNEDTLEMHKCLIWDDGSLNKTRLNNSENCLVKQEKQELCLDDFIQFGSLKFKFQKMTESEFKEQQKNPNKLIDIYTDTNLNGTSPVKKQAKINGLFEIQNTLEETVLIENLEDSEKQNGYKMYVADTDPEDNESLCEDTNLNNTSCPDFRLHMSASFINQSVVSSRSILIPETMDDEEDLDETRDNGEANKQVTDEHKTSEEKPVEEKQVQNEVEMIVEQPQEQTQVVEEPKSPSIVAHEKVNDEQEPTQVVEETQKLETLPDVESKKTIETTQTSLETVNEIIEEKKSQDSETNVQEKTEIDETDTKMEQVEDSKEQQDIPVEVIEEKKEDNLVQKHEEEQTENKITENNESKQELTDEKPTEEVSGEKPTEEISDEKPTEEVSDEKPTEEISENEKQADEEKVEEKTEEEKQENEKEKEDAVEILDEKESKEPEDNELKSEIVIEETKIIETETIPPSETKQDDQIVKIDQIKIDEDKNSQKPGFEVKKYDSMKDESIIINDDDDDDDVQVNFTKQDNSKHVKNIILADKDKQTDDIIVESTLLDTSDLNLKSQPASQLSETEPSQTAEIIEEKKEEKPSRRGRGRSTRNSIVNNSLEDAEKDIQESDQKVETKSEEQKTETTVDAKQTRRSTRASVPPSTPVTQPVKETRRGRKRASDVQNESKNIEETHTNEDKKIDETEKNEEKIVEESEKAIVEEKQDEKVQEKKDEKIEDEIPDKSEKVDDEKTDEKTEDKADDKEGKATRVTRRSSLRSRNAPPAAASKLKRGVKVVEEEDAKSEDEPTQAKISKQDEESKPKSTRRKSMAPVTIKKDDPEEEPKEQEEEKRSLRNRRKTIEVSQVKTQEDPKKETKKVTRRKSVKQDNHYQYDDEEETKKTTSKRKSDEHENLKNKKSRRAKLDQSSEEDNHDDNDDAQPEEEKKQTRKRKTSEQNKQDLDDSFTRDFKQAQTETKSESDSTPKIFFNSKRRTTPNTSLNTTPKASASATDTPSKKFKLHKTKSSSEDNLNQSSDEEVVEKKIKKIEEFVKPTEPIETEKKIEPKDEESKPKVVKKVTRTSSARLSVAPTRTSSRAQRGSQSVPHIIVSGMTLTDKDKQGILSKGGVLVDDVKECTHLITNKIRMNFKFLSCLTKGAFIVSEKWLNETIKGKMFANPQTYALVDTHTEKQYKFSLQTSLSKAKSHPLFNGWKFLLKCDKATDEVSLDELKVLIECAGGETAESLDDTDLDSYCVVYKDYDAYKNDDEYKSKEVLKTTLDNLLDSILKQSFDSKHDIEASNQLND